ncbi:hypothetical protein [Aquimonas sp.]|jgi:hypothetical protein|uniref:hypothetical protein n=1 Tax=Aquimonas sp. TaxID=1872588 RepID=UPI0037C01842
MKASLKGLWTSVSQSYGWEGLKKGRCRIAGFWLTFMPMWWFFGSLYLAAPAALALLFAADRLRARYMRTLEVRMNAKDSASWDVEINQVKVGQLSDADYALIRYRVFSDERVYIAQSFNLLRVAVNAIDSLVLAIPIGAFWVAVALLILSPETITSVLAALQHATPSDLRHALGTASPVLVLVIMVSFAFNWMFGLSRFGFINRFDDAVGTAIRKRLGVAAEGDCLLSRWAEGSVVFTNERATIRFDKGQ